MGSRFAKQPDRDRSARVSVALVGNPNVGKSTLVNTMTGMKRHTGNWAGKTVSTAVADVYGDGRVYSVADIPGTYSLLSHSYEEEIARNYICFGGADITVIVCDATALSHGLNLVLQVLEVTKNAIVVLNLMDEAEKRGVSIDTDALSRLLGVPVVTTVARKRSSIDRLVGALDSFDSARYQSRAQVIYHEKIENAVSMVEGALKEYELGALSSRWVALRLIEGDLSLCADIERSISLDVNTEPLSSAIKRAVQYLFSSGIDGDEYRDLTVGALAKDSEAIAHAVIKQKNASVRERDLKIDKILTGKYTAFPIMLLLLAAVMLITMSLANYPSMLLSELFSFLEVYIRKLFILLHLPKLVTGALIDGVYMTLARVVAVMLPPMAIFFPMFTLLEDSGYLPRVAYNLDRPFAACGACGKQSLTMCMGLGCNAVGISGARIIDSPRERLIAIITNGFIPCNGKLPMILSLVSVAFICGGARGGGVLVGLVFVGCILLSVGATFLFTFILSKTVLRGEPSSFVLELPPYRKPEVLRVIYRSLTSRVVSVLGRAVAVAAPMGLLIFALSNIYISGQNLISLSASLLDPFGKAFGMDGAIMLAFILGIPANEIVLPLLVMIYLSGGGMADVDVLAMSELFISCGWTLKTAVCTSIFALFHFPCSTAIITGYKETKSIKYTALLIFLPLLFGLLLAFLVNLACCII